jgi:hypothetical protein
MVMVVKKPMRSAEEQREDRLSSPPRELWIDGVKVWDRDEEDNSKSSSPQDVIRRTLKRGPRKAK